MLSLYQLSIFLAVAETNNFSAAAHKLHLTQPAVSQQIRALEHYLGFKLFARDGQRMELTENASSLLPLAKELLEKTGRVEDAVATLKGVVTGQLVISSSAAPCKYVLPPIIGMFRREYPSVRVTLRIDEGGDAVAALRAREADIGFVSHRPSEKGFEVRRVFKDELVLLVPRKHRWARTAKVPLQDIKQAEMVVLGSNSGTRKSFEEVLRKEGISAGDFSISMEVGSTEAAATAVEAGFGVCVISGLVAKRIGHRVKAVPLDGASFMSDIYMIRNRQHTPSLAQLRFCEFLKSAEVVQLLEEQTGGNPTGKEKLAK